MEVARSRLWAPDGCEEDQVGVCCLVLHCDPYQISDPKKCHFSLPFSDLSSKIHIQF